MNEWMILAFAGWILAALALGLWWGERGRRKDLAWIQGLALPGVKADPKVETHTPETEEAEAVRWLERDTLAKNLKEELAAEGTEITDAQALDEATRILSEVEQAPTPAEV